MKQDAFKVMHNEIKSVEWGEAGKVHDWRNHVPKRVQHLWQGFTDEQRFELFLWAEQLADAEEWE